MDQDFINTLLLTGKLAGWTTFILFIVGLPMAYLLAYKRFWFKPIVEALISMPMVLPPTVLGFYMLLAYSPQNGIGRFLSVHFNTRLAFSFQGVLIASVIFSLPFMIQPLQNGLISIPKSLREASYTLGKSKFTTFIRVLIPNMIPSIITAIAMTFAHCIGEFGVIIMVGGNIPGETRVLSVAIYNHVEAMEYTPAHFLAGGMVLFSFIVLLSLYLSGGKLWRAR